MRLLYRSVSLVGEEVDENEATITSTITSPSNDQTCPSNHHVEYTVTAPIFLVFPPPSRRNATAAQLFTHNKHNKTQSRTNHNGELPQESQDIQTKV